MLIQGTVDTLFTLQEADDNAMALIAQGCSDQGGVVLRRARRLPSARTNDGELIERATLDWLDRYVKGDLSVTTGPQFEWVDQHGQ